MPNMVAFPDDRLIGYLHLLESDGPMQFHGRFKKNGEWLPDALNPGWRLLGEATGSIEVPEGASVLLEVLPEEARDLSPLAALGPHDLQGIWLGNTWVDDEQLMQIRHLVGLEWIDLQNNGDITDAGIDHLKGLENLVSFGAHWTRITGRSLRLLSKMQRLSFLDIRGCQIEPDSVAELMTERPNCQVRTE